MVTLKLKSKPPASGTPGMKRAPVRGVNAPRKQVTLAQKQAERADRSQRPTRPESDPHSARNDRDARGARDAHGDRAVRDARDVRGDRRDTGERVALPARGRSAPARAAPARPQPERSAPAHPDRREPARPSPARADPTRPPSARRSSERPPAPERADPTRRAPSRAPVTRRSSARIGATAPRVEGQAEGERLSKRLTAQGIASRREADDWIAAGWVRVEGKLAVLGQRVGPDARIEIDPRARQEQAQRVTILLNKPVGYVSGQAEDGHQPASVLVRPENQWSEDRSGIRFSAGHARGLAPAGRLDIDSVGLLVLTQDGRVAKQLIGDDSRVEKEYLVRVQHKLPGPLPPEKIALLELGLEIDGRTLRPAKVSWANEDQLRIVLREGMKRQIRRMCELVGLEVLGLKRVRIGSVPLGHLPAGQWRYLRADEHFI